MESFLAPWLQLFAPQPCYDEFFVKYNFFHVVCLKVVLSKCLGYAIIAGSILVKIPQILKILKSGSAKGISIVSVSVELCAISANLAYGFSKGFPFSAYGDAVFLAIQTFIIAVLVLTYGGNNTGAFIYSVIYIGLLSFILSPSVPADVLWFLQASVMPNIVIARMLQATENYRNSSTGQLSAITVFLLFFGAMARVFTSIQETGDAMIIATYATGSLCNCILVAQILYYWNSDATKAQADDKKTK